MLCFIFLSPSLHSGDKEYPPQCIARPCDAVLSGTRKTTNRKKNNMRYDDYHQQKKLPTKLTCEKLESTARIALGNTRTIRLQKVSSWGTLWLIKWESQLRQNFHFKWMKTPEKYKIAFSFLTNLSKSKSWEILFLSLASFVVAVILNSNLWHA